MKTIIISLILAFAFASCESYTPIDPTYARAAIAESWLTRLGFTSILFHADQSSSCDSTYPHRVAFSALSPSKLHRVSGCFCFHTHDDPYIIFSDSTWTPAKKNNNYHKK